MSASFMTAAVAALTAVASPVRAVQAEAGETVAAIRTPSVACVFDKRTGTLNSIVGTASGSKLVSAGDNEPLFQLVFAETGSEKKVYLSSLHARDRSVVASSSSGIARLTLEFSRLDGRDVSATCTVWAAEKERAVHLRISVKFGKGLQLETVQFPFLRLAVPLGADANDDAVVMGRTKGGLLRAPLRWPEGTAVAARQPGSLAAQFACYYDPRGGLYTACHDTAGHPKGIVLARDAAGLRMCWEQYTFSEDGQYELGYDVVVDSFGASGSASADWRDAADIYKSWAIKQAWCAKTYSRRPDVPKWMKAGPAMVRFGRDWLSEPQAILEWIDAYWRKYFPSQVPLIVAFWGWEKHGAWITPDYFPAFPSDEEFTALVAELRKRNCHVFLWPSGYHFTLTRGAKPDGSFEYDARELFQRHFAPHAVWTRRGEPYHGPRSWLQGGETACMCPGDPWTIDWLNGIAVEICKRGVEIVQIDQVVGGSFQWCYSRHHPHPPGPGPWMTEAFRRQLATMLSACRSVERDAIIGFEEPNEYFNQQVAIQDYRDTEAASANPPAEPASVFGYLYHEYLPCFQSNPQAGDAFGLAYCLVTGQIPHFVPLRIFKPGPALVDGGFEEWRGEVPRWWEKVSGWQGKAYDGRCFRAGEAHSGRWCLGLECTEQGQIVQVAQNVLAGDGLSPGRKYAVSAWAKSKAIAESCSLLVAALAPGPGVKVLQGWSAQIPKEGDSWAPIRVELVLPENTSYLRIMLHLVGPGQAWFDDVVLEEVLPDGTLRTAMRKGVPAEQKLLEQWVRLFSGPGRDFLLLGQMRHPPRLDTDHVSTGRFEVPAILHNQFRAADGREAVVLANWTGDHRTGTLYLRTRELPVSVEPLGVLLLDAKTGRPIQ